MGVTKVFPSSLWLSDLRTFVGKNGDRGTDPDKPAVVGILAFEAAAVMSRIVSLYRSLSDQEVHRLRSDTMRSQGVAYLNSTDQVFLLRLACAELIGDLDRAAASVARFGRKCLSALPRSFERDYSELKAGGRVAYMEWLGLGSKGKSVEKKVRKMERYVAATSRLYAEMERLNELEAVERRITEQWRRHSGPIPIQKPPPPGSSAGPDELQLELKAQRHKVRRSKEESLWNKTYDKAVELMAGAVFTVLSRIFTVFSPVVCLPPSYDGKPMLRSYLNIPSKYSSGPLEKPATKDVVMLRNSAPILLATKDPKPLGNWNKLLEPPPTTLGGSGLALRYANVIASAQKLLAKKSAVDSREPQNDEEEDGDEEAAEREELYRMIPAGMRASVKAKLRECWRTEGGRAAEDGSMAEGWKGAVESILSWLAPVAHDTLRWHDERNMDRQQRFDTQPRALMLQTLHFADSDKTEAAIVEVLVGLSCMSWYEERQHDSIRYQIY